MSGAIIDRTPGELNAIKQRGDSLSETAVFSIALAGCTATSEILSLVTNERVALVAASVTSSGTSGVISFSMTKAEVAALPAGTYRWKTKVGSSPNDAVTYLDGWFEVRR
jgi:hypothetical protein